MSMVSNTAGSTDHMLLVSFLEACIKRNSNKHLNYSKTLLLYRELVFSLVVKVHGHGLET